MILMKTDTHSTERLCLSLTGLLHITQSLLTDSIFVVRFLRYEDCSFFDRMLFVNEIVFLIYPASEYINS